MLNRRDAPKGGMTQIWRGKHGYFPSLSTYDRVRTIPTALPIATRSILAAAAAIIIADIRAAGAVGLVSNARRGGGRLLRRLR